MNNLHVKTGDTAVVLSGKEKGKRGKVLSVDPKKGMVVIEGVNMIKCHTKPRRQGETGGIIEREGTERAATDYISGMTDGYAMEKYGELFIPFAWTVK